MKKAIALLVCMALFNTVMLVSLHLRMTLQTKQPTPVAQRLVL